MLVLFTSAVPHSRSVIASSFGIEKGSERCLLNTVPSDSSFRIALYSTLFKAPGHSRGRELVSLSSGAATRGRRRAITTGAGRIRITFWQKHAETIITGSLGEAETDKTYKQVRKPMGGEGRSLRWVHSVQSTLQSCIIFLRFVAARTACGRLGRLGPPLAGLAATRLGSRMSRKWEIRTRTCSTRWNLATQHAQLKFSF